MLSIKELEKLYDILNSKQQTLYSLSQLLQNTFNEPNKLFDACYTLSNFLILNLLTNQQRFISLFLLLDNYKTQGIKKNPFANTIISISYNTTQAFQRIMIAEIILEKRRDKYGKMKIEAIFEDEQAMIDYIQQRIQIRKLRQQLMAQLPQISSNKSSEVYRVIRDFNQKQKVQCTPDFPINKNSIKQAELSQKGFNTNFLRPIPTFLPISQSQPHWLSPGIITDVHWDDKSELDKKLTKVKKIMLKALTCHLTSQQCQEVEKILQKESYTVLSFDIPPQSIQSLIKQNSRIAAIFLIKISQYPIIKHYLNALLHAQLSTNILDVVTRLIKGAKIENLFILKFTLLILEEAKKLPQQNANRKNLAKMVANFVKNIVKNKIIEINSCKEACIDFCKPFLEIDEVQSLYKILMKQ